MRQTPKRSDIYFFECPNVFLEGAYGGENGGLPAHMIKEEIAPSCLTSEEISEAIGNFSEADWLRLRKVASCFAQRCPMEANDLLQEAFIRALGGQRNCPCHVDVVKFLAEVMRSISSDACKLSKRKQERHFVPNMDDKSELSEIGSQEDELEDAFIQEEECIRIKTAILALFKDDEIAQIIVEGMMEDMQGEDLRSLTNLDNTAFASKRRMIRRRIDKAFPKGWKS